MAAIKTVQNQIFTGDGKEFTTVSFTVRKPESQWDNSLEFGKCCEDLSWNHGTSTPYRSETNGVAARVVRRIQEGTSAVLLQSGLDEKWWADTMAGYCYLWNVQDLLSDEKTPYERRFGDPFKGPGIPFGSMVEYHPFLRKTSPHSINLVRKFYLQHSSDMHCLRVRIWKGDLMVADIGELENLDASEIHAGSLIAKTVFMPKNGEHFMLSENPPPSRITLNETTSITMICEDKRTGLNHETRWRMTLKPETTFGRSQGITLIVIKLTQEFNSMWRKKKHSQYHWNTLTLSGGRIPQWMCCWKASRRFGRVSRSSQFWMKNVQTDLRGQGGGWQKFKQRQDPIIHGQRCGQGWQRQLNEEKNSNGRLNNRSSTMPESWEASTFLVQKIWSARKPWKNATHNWNCPCNQECLCKVQNFQRREACGKEPSTPRWRYACVVEARESARKHLERTLPKDREDRIEGINSLSHYNLVRKFIPMRRALKIPVAKAAVDKEWEKLEKLPALQMTKVRSKKKGVIKKAMTVPFCYAIGYLFWNSNRNSKNKYRGRVVPRGDIVKYDSVALMLFSPSRVRQHLKWRPPRSWISSPDCQVAMDRQPTQYQLIPMSTMEDAPRFLNSEVRMSRHMETSSTTNGKNLGRPLKIQWFFLNEICTVTHLLGSCGKEVLLEFWMGVNTELGMSVCSSKTMIILIGLCGWYWNDSKKAEYGSCVEQMDETRWSGRTNIVSWPWKFGMYSTWMQVERRYCWWILKMYESRICARATEKLPGCEKSHAITIAWSCDMEGHAKKCVKRSCEFANKSVESNCTRSLHHVLMAINSWWCRNYCLNVRRSQAIQRWTGPALMVQWRWRSPREERGMEWSPVVSPLRSVFCVTFCSLHRCNITCHIRQRGCVLIFGFLLKEHVDARRKAK